MESCHVGLLLSKTMASLQGRDHIETVWGRIWSEVHTLISLFSCLSLIACLITSILCWKYPRLRRMPGDLMWLSTLCESVVAVCCLVLVLDSDFDKKAQREDFCDGPISGALSVLMLTIVFFETMASAIRLSMYFHVLSIYLNPFRAERRRWRPIAAVVVGLSSCMFCKLFFFDRAAHSERKCREAYFASIALGFFLIPMALHTVLGGLLDLVIRSLIYNIQRKARRRDDPASICFLERQRVMRHSTAYLLIYGVQTALGFAFMIWLADTKEDDEDVLGVVWAFVVVLSCGRPAVSFVFWLVINDIVYILCGVCSCFKQTSHSTRTSSRFGRSRSHSQLFTRPSGNGRGLSVLAESRLPSMAEINRHMSGESSLDGLDPVERDAVAAAATLADALADDPNSVQRAASLAESVSDLRARSPSYMEFQQRLEQVAGAMNLRANTLQGVAEAGFKEELRFELLYYVAHGIGEDVQQELLAGPRVSLNNDDESRRAVGLVANRAETSTALRRMYPSESAAQQARSLDRGAVPFHITNGSFGRFADRARADVWMVATRLLRPGAPHPESNRMVRSAGTSITISTASPSPLLQTTPFGLQRSYSNGDQPLPTPSQPSRGPTVSHYEKDKFREIRIAFGITQAVFAGEFPSNVNKWDHAWTKRLKESVSEGASGSFFYRVINRSPVAERTSGAKFAVESKFIIKQITKKEKKTLMALMPAYHAHVLARRGRSLIQYFGLYSMPLWWQGSGKVYFVVMRNFLPVRQWLTFDLKGATANRRALDPKVLHSIHAGEDPRCQTAWGTLRDWEWMDISMVCDLSPEDKSTVLDAIVADSHFLASQNLMDYSLLVGIHRLSNRRSPQEKEERLRALQKAGGYISVDRQKVYFFGIIDVLEKYDCSWAMQRAVLTAAYCVGCKCDKADGITALPPVEYAERFRTFVEKEVLNFDVQMVRALSPSPSMADSGEESWVSRRSPASSGATCSCLSPVRRCSECCLPNAETRRGGPERWACLWERRRRGLIRERIECERLDHMQRIADLEAQVELQSSSAASPSATGSRANHAATASASASGANADPNDPRLPPMILTTDES